MKIKIENIRHYRLCAHHLDRKLSQTEIQAAAGACGLQNSPPGAWETAMFQRIKGCTLQSLHTSLYEKRELVQAWGRRGVPVVFPTAQSEIFLTPLVAREGEEPWIYTRGITGALDFLGMRFEDLLPLVKKAAAYLDKHTVRSKELLDSTLAEIVEKELPQEKRALWKKPSMYGSPDKQTVGGAAVSFLLRPCSFESLVVFGGREGISPTFTSFEHWVGHRPVNASFPDQELTRKFLHCYGPATVQGYAGWLGCSLKQAKRLWDSVSGEMEAVEVEGRTCYMLADDIGALTDPKKCEDDGKLMLLGAHDPYLETSDRRSILENQALHKVVWRTVANPGVVLKDGRAAGIWRQKTQKGKLDIVIEPFEALTGSEKKRIEVLAEEYASFRSLVLNGCSIGL